MKKIFSINGDKQGKTLFVETIREKGYYVWSVNPWDNISRFLVKFFSNTKPSAYYEILTGIYDLMNKKIDYANKYLEQNITHFNDFERGQILFIHGINKDTAKSLKEKYGLITLHVATENDPATSDYDKVFMFDGDSNKFKDEVAKYMKSQE